MVHTVLCLCSDSLCLLGPCCGSWGIPARFTTMRSYINVMGATHLPFVAEANQTISLSLVYYSSIPNIYMNSLEIMGSVFELPGYLLRVVLLCMLLLAKHCHFVLEHPFQSLIVRHHRWEWFCNVIAFVTLLQSFVSQIPILYMREFV